MTFDQPLFFAVNAFARTTPWLHALVAGYATYGELVFAVLLAAGLLAARVRADPRVMAAALWAPVGMLAALGVAQPISTLVGEARPCQALPGIEVLARCGKDFSFPSDHATMAGAVAVGVLLVSRRLLGWVAVLAALAMAGARVYVGVHYPHDVAAGLVLGAAVAVAGWLLLRSPLTRLVTALSATRLRPLLVS